MEIRILELIEGAKQATGLAVVIDVLRAFSLEVCLFAQGAEKIYPIGDMGEAFAMKAAHPDWLLFGERGGAKVEGCDYGNSPTGIAGIDFSGRTLIHSTSAGTQGIVNCSGADEIITGSLLNAEAIAEYIKKKDPKTVSFCAMGNAGIRRANEDVLCAEYIKSILLGEPMPDIKERARELEWNGAEHFFNEKTQHIYPKPDFFKCIEVDTYDLVIGVSKDADGRFVAQKVSG
jgi:2-phosphosulfolactate phosphatase